MAPGFKRYIKWGLVAGAAGFLVFASVGPVFVAPHTATSIAARFPEGTDSAELVQAALAANGAAQRCLGVFLVCMALWFTNLIPLSATALLGLALIMLILIGDHDLK